MWQWGSPCNKQVCFWCTPMHPAATSGKAVLAPAHCTQPHRAASINCSRPVGIWNYWQALFQECTSPSATRSEERRILVSILADWEKGAVLNRHSSFQALPVQLSLSEKGKSNKHLIQFPCPAVSSTFLKVPAKHLVSICNIYFKLKLRNTWN